MVLKNPNATSLLLIFIITTASIATVHPHPFAGERVGITSPNQEAMTVTTTIIGGRKILAMKKNDFNVNDEEEKIKNSDASGGFVVVNADYHSPRHHPPKNN